MVRRQPEFIAEDVRGRTPISGTVRLAALSHEYRKRTSQNGSLHLTIANQPIAQKAVAPQVYRDPRAIAGKRHRSETRCEHVVIVALIVCTLEGALRKWVIPTNYPMRYLAYF